MDGKEVLDRLLWLRKIDRNLEQQAIIIRRMIAFRKEWVEEYHRKSRVLTNEQAN